MTTEFKVFTPPPSLAGKPIDSWNGVPRHSNRQDPETCHCGKVAIYRHPTKHNVGYCKEHHAEAVKVTSAMKHRGER